MAGCSYCEDGEGALLIEAWRNLMHLANSGAVLVLPSGDELTLTPESISDYLMGQAERAEEAANEAYYGGDAPGSYGPSDPQGR